MLFRSQLHVESGCVFDDHGFGRWRVIVPPERSSLSKCQPPHSLTARAWNGFKCDGAGVLPVMQPPGKTSTYFVLGKQTFRPHNPLCGGRWYFFGGRPEETDSDTATIAAREFLEETLGTVLWQDVVALAPGGARVMRSAGVLAQSLREQEFMLCIRLAYMRHGKPRFYDVFVVKVPWDPAIPLRFQKLRAALHLGDEAPKHNGRRRQHAKAKA